MAGIAVGLLSPLASEAQFEIGVGENLYSAASQISHAKGDLITWDGVDGYISARTVNEYGSYLGVTFDLVDQNGCLLTSIMPSLLASPTADAIYVTAVKTVGPDEFVFVGHRLADNEGCQGSSYDIVVGHYSRTQVWTNWIQTYGDDGSDEFAYDVIIDSDDRIVFTGFAQRQSCAYPGVGLYKRKYMLVGKLRMDGFPPADGGTRIYRESQWVNQTQMNRNFGFEGLSIIEQDDPEGSGKEYVIGGRQSSNDFGYYQAFIMRIHHDITTPVLRKKKRFPFESRSEGRDLIKLSNGDLALIGDVSNITGGQGGKDCFVTVFPADLVSVNCNDVPRAIFGASGADRAYSIIEDDLGFHYISGNSNSYATKDDVFLLKGYFNSGTGMFTIAPNTGPSNFVSFYGGAGEQVNHNVVFDNRSEDVLHLFNRREYASTQYPNYQINVPESGRSSGCEYDEDFFEYTGGECIPLNGAHGETNLSIPYKYYEEYMLKFPEKYDYCESASCKGASSENEVDAAQDMIARSMSIFPNPANDVLTLRTTLRPEQILVLDVRGSVVTTFSSAPQGNQQLDISNLDAGIYFLQVQVATGTETIKFVKE